MKPLLKITILMLTFLVFACSEDDAVQLSEESTQLELSASATDKAFNPNLGIKLKASSTSCNLINKIDLSILSQIDQNFSYDSNGNRVFHFSGGTLSLLNQNTGCQLDGMLDGKVIDDAGRVIIDAQADVICGSGSLEATDGNLRILIIGVPNGDSFDIMNYSVEIDGFLVSNRE